MKKNLVVFGLAGLTLFSACSSNENSSNDEVQEPSDKSIADELNNEEQNEAQKVFYALPSPFEVSSLLKASGVEFEDGILNPFDNLSKYTTTSSQALNLGIYGADVSITSIYDKTQETMLYLSCIKKLADDLGITTAFGSETMERLESSKESQDSLQRIVAEAYSLANAYLKENARSSSSSLILTGGWIEGVYIATSLVDPSDPNQDLVELIADQRFSIENLISLLELNKNEEVVAGILTDLKELNELFSQIEDGESHEVTTSTSEGGAMVLGGGSSVTISPELLDKITKKVSEIRTGLIS